MKKMYLSIAKKWAIALLFFSFSARLIADEGMWLPFLLKTMNEKEMQKNGCLLKAEDIYSINKSSLKDAIVQFGGGCTGEIISDKGLMLTNHHCGYSQIAAHSTVQKDYLTNGFWAMKASEEIPNPGLTATFIIRIEDVTAELQKAAGAFKEQSKKDSAMKARTKELEHAAVENTHYEAFTRPFFYGNMHLLFVTEVFKDVRLVGAPPSSIGKFGGDTDNWMWPRHTGDFSIFRIYAGPNNKPADYSPNNKPFVPRKSLTISLKGVKEGDFTMVFGFPGKTQEYLFSEDVALTQNESDPVKVDLRAKRLEIMHEYMAQDPQVRINMASSYASIANYWKKWKGEMQGLQSFHAVEKKKEFESKFLALISTDPLKKEQFNQVFEQFHQCLQQMKLLTRQMNYYSEGLTAIPAFNHAKVLEGYVEALKSKDVKVAEEVEKMKKYAQRFSKTYLPGMDEKMCIAVLNHYFKGLESSLRVPFLDSLYQEYKSGEKISHWLLSKSRLLNPDTLMLIFTSPQPEQQISKDPLFITWHHIQHYYGNKVRPALGPLDTKLNELYKTYMKGQMEAFPQKRFYPDANSTLRVTYGKVKGYQPRDGVKYNYFTTLDGIMEKEQPESEEFHVSPKLKELYQKKDFGPYADKDGKIHVSFVATNHTTGGNSGSPVLNAKGELIGTNYDRVWEGTMSDIMYNPEICRNITLDIRYTLFVIDKYAGAGYLVNEMKIAK